MMCNRATQLRARQKEISFLEINKARDLPSSACKHSNGLFDSLLVELHSGNIQINAQVRSCCTIRSCFEVCFRQRSTIHQGNCTSLYARSELQCYGEFIWQHIFPLKTNDSLPNNIIHRCNSTYGIYILSLIRVYPYKYLY